MVDLFHRLESKAFIHPDKLLYCFLDRNGCESESHTYESFLHRVKVISRHLREESGLTKGDRVVLAYPPGLEMVCALFGCVGAGLVPVPVSVPAEFSSGVALGRIEGIATDCKASLILTNSAGSHQLLRAINAEVRRSGRNFPALNWIETDGIENVAGSLDVPEESSLFLLQYTSGSTGKPKGVKVSVGNVISNCSIVVDHPNPIAVSWLPQHHDMGLLGYYVFIALSGGTTYGMAPATFIQRPSLWLQTISRFKATASSAPNFAFEWCLRPSKLPDSMLDDLDLSSLRFLMAAAEPISPDTFRRFLHRFEPHGLQPESFIVAYGLAESTLAVTNHGRNTMSLDRRALARGMVLPVQQVSQIDNAIHVMSCGLPLGQNRIAIVNPDTSQRCIEAKIGEIWIASDSNCLGYWNNAEATSCTFEAKLSDETGSWLRTGDMGYLQDNELYVCGRRKDTIIVRGENYYPQDIESIVERHCAPVRPGSVAAFQVDTHDDSIVVVAGIASRDRVPNGRTVSAAIRAEAGIDIDCIAFVPARSVPTTSSGKVMRHACRHLWQNDGFQLIGMFQREKHESDDPPGEYLEGTLGEIRRRYGLRGDEQHSLIEAGIDSLDLVMLLHELRESVEYGETADRIDLSLIQDVSIATLFRFFEAVRESSAENASHLRTLVDQTRSAHRTTELAAMREDARLKFKALRTTPLVLKPTRSILLTGGTGFFGPHLILSLLEQTEAKLHVLTRGSNSADSENRIRSAFQALNPTKEMLSAFGQRVVPVCGDLSKPGFGMASATWSALSNEIDTIYHNGALVNYLFSYGVMRNTNVMGTTELLRFAQGGQPKQFNHISTTFIFGWATKSTLYETDSNESMELLDFGYSQSKWVAEQCVIDAASKGLPTRIFRPALLTPTVDGMGGEFDITIRLLCFMIKHGISVRAQNQVSLIPAEVAANNIVAIGEQMHTIGGTFHVTRDTYSNMAEITELIAAQTGRRFEYFSLPDFVPEVIRRCSRDDLLYPLLDFLVGSIDNISAMEFKRYDSSRYRHARDASRFGRSDPSLAVTVNGILRFMERKGLIHQSQVVQAEP